MTHAEYEEMKNLMVHGLALISTDYLRNPEDFTDISNIALNNHLKIRVNQWTILFSSLRVLCALCEIF